VISDVPKTMCIDWPAGSIATRKSFRSLITKAPSAELRRIRRTRIRCRVRPLDAILEEYVVRQIHSGDLRGGFEESVVKRVVRLIDGTEYKRRQSAPGLKVTSKASASGAHPIAQRYREA